MAHRSKKKHIKHLHEHELGSSPPKAKTHPGAKADIEEDRIARPRATARKATGAGKKPAAKKRGIVRRIAKAATKKIAAKPKKIIQRAKSRVKAMLGRE